MLLLRSLLLFKPGPLRCFGFRQGVNFVKITSDTEFFFLNACSVCIQSHLIFTATVKSGSYYSHYCTDGEREAQRD